MGIYLLIHHEAQKVESCGNSHTNSIAPTRIDAGIVSPSVGSYTSTEAEKGENGEHSNHIGVRGMNVNRTEVIEPLITLTIV